jgi:hypothetical protein
MIALGTLAAPSIPFSATRRSRKARAARWSFGEAFARSGCRAA